MIHVRLWVRELAAPVAVVYEAGPTGFGLYRALTRAGVRCVVAAPSKVQRPSGDRVKTDARDAIHLARLLRLDEITPVAVPSGEQEVARDLVRAREDCRGDLMRARHRPSKLLLRHGIVYSGGRAWTGGPRHLDASSAVHQSGGADGVRLRLRHCAHRPRTPRPARRSDHGHGRRQRDHSKTIGAFRGPGAQRVLLRRLPHTGPDHQDRPHPHTADPWSKQPGTTTPRYIPGKTLRDRWELAPLAARARGDAGNRRLHDRWITFNLRRKRHVIANVAIARELAGWCWSLTVID